MRHGYIGGDNDIWPVFFNAGNDFIRITRFDRTICDQRFATAMNGALSVGKTGFKINMPRIQHFCQQHGFSLQHGAELNVLFLLEAIIETARVMVFS